MKDYKIVSRKSFKGSTVKQSSRAMVRSESQSPRSQSPLDYQPRETVTLPPLKQPKDNLTRYTSVDSRYATPYVKTVTKTDRINTEAEVLFKFIENNEIGNNVWFTGPFRYLKVVYCDYTASGRSLNYIEDFIRNDVMPYYGNTHSTTTKTALQTSFYRDEARNSIKKSVNASEDDVAIFTGSGSTSAIHKFINILELKSNSRKGVIVFVSIYEHHSNLLPWKELPSAEVVTINETLTGGLDINDLKAQLEYYNTKPYCDFLKIGSFTAASNISGILTDVKQIATLMHKYNGLACFDYATAAPYMRIDMNPCDEYGDYELAYKDAVFISPHKFIGGPQTPGLLIAKKKHFQNKTPDNCGGGTVNYVTNVSHYYTDDIETREEGGTPAIIESIRAGIVFQLKEDCGVDNIMKREHQYMQKALLFLKTIDNLKILGSIRVERLPIFSFVIEHKKTGLYLHPKFVTSLLNDLFGVQTRAGCACAGPYAIKCMGLKSEHTDYLVHQIDRGREIFKSGFVRFSLTYFMSEERVNFILQSIKFVAEHGWKFLQYYSFTESNGEWQYNDTNKLGLNLNSLKKINLEYMQTAKNKFQQNFNSLYYEESLRKAYETVKTFEANRYNLNVFRNAKYEDRKKEFVWFLCPIDSYNIQHGNDVSYLKDSLFAQFAPLKY